MNVVITGCFDLLHAGHVRMFSEIKETYPKFNLVVLVDTDERIKKSKGDSRPYNKLEHRIEVLESIKHINCVYPFDTDERLIEYLAFFKPIRIVGEEYRNKPIIGKEYCERVEYHPKYDNLSTTQLIERIQDSVKENYKHLEELLMTYKNAINGYCFQGNIRQSNLCHEAVPDPAPEIEFFHSEVDADKVLILLHGNYIGRFHNIQYSGSKPIWWEMIEKEINLNFQQNTKIYQKFKELNDK